MEKVYRQDIFHKGCLKKLIVPREKVTEMRGSLFRKGFTESVVFPDLEGLSSEMKREFGF